ncbi:MAG: glutamate synthase large subunit, partial [Gammaproteobacteria bacterium]
MQHTSVKQQGLYRPGEFKDNCGFGLIAHMHGEPSHGLVQKAIESLTCMTHRGGIAADGRTGDGCGLLLQMPKEFFRQIIAQEFGEQLHRAFGVGMLFLPTDASACESAKAEVDQKLVAEGLRVIGWRVVPTHAAVCGDIARAQLPSIQQVFVVGHDTDDDLALNRKLYMARRRVELSLSAVPDFYVVSLSASVIGYKGLVMPADLAVFYKDLAAPELETAICVFHQRFSTNTLPRWPLAQPFRFLAHNGEINTIMGNRNWSVARTSKLRTPYLPELKSVVPLVNRDGSDSSALDNMLEVMLLGGVDLFRAVRMLIPPAWQNVDTMDPKLRAFYNYNSMHVEPWDGPAGIVLSDGRYAVCLLDRNGLRPARYVITNDNLITLASEVGTHGYTPESVVAKGRVGPGQILAVDTHTGELLHARDIDDRLKVRQPYGRWLKTNAKRLKSRFTYKNVSVALDDAQLLMWQKLFQVTREERDYVIRPMAENGQEAVGSMGDDTPMAVLSHRVRPFTDYFRQQFAQVTNPPIDPLRETVVMSLETCIGPERNLFEETPEHANRIILRSPILSNSKFQQLMAFSTQGFLTETVSLYYDVSMGLEAAIRAVCDAAEAAVRRGVVMLVLSDRGRERDRLPIQAALATGAVHHRLVQAGLRCDCNIIVETATARDPHHFAVLVGFGATAVYPYLAYHIVVDLVSRGEVLNSVVDAQKRYRKSIAKGLLKILSKMGISTIASYRGAQLFEIVGLHESVVDLCFRGAVSRISGADFGDLQADQAAISREAWNSRKSLSAGGLLKYVHNMEYHAYNPDVIQTLHCAVRSGDYADYRRYVSIVMERGITHLRDVLDLNSPNAPIDIDEVEPIEAILKRFD